MRSDEIVWHLGLHPIVNMTCGFDRQTNVNKFLWDLNQRLSMPWDRTRTVTPLLGSFMIELEIFAFQFEKQHFQKCSLEIIAFRSHQWSFLETFACWRILFSAYICALQVPDIENETLDLNYLLIFSYHFVLRLRLEELSVLFPSNAIYTKTCQSRIFRKRN